MRASRIVAIVIGCLILLPGLGLLLGGGALGIFYLAGRNDSGYFETPLTELQSPTAAITADTPTVTTDRQDPSWLLELFDTDVKVVVTAEDSDSQTFLGVGPSADVNAYLSNTRHDEIIGFTDGSPVYRTATGQLPAADPPTDQHFWSMATSGPGTQQLTWHPTEGPSTVVIMNSDGSPDITTHSRVQFQAGSLLPLVMTLLVLGLFVTAAAVALIVVGAGGADPRHSEGLPPSDVAHHPAAGRTATNADPVALRAALDPGLTRWKWLFKWFLAIPHYIVLALLWPAFLVITIIAGFAILFTGRYPRPLFEFTSGVLRWSWRVSYYAASGGLGTDRYPPFSLQQARDYPATLDIAYPGRLSRGLVLVKWWLLALPHYLIIGFFVSNWWDWTPTGERFAVGPIGTGGLFGLLVLITALVLLITGKYPAQLFALIVGFNRWIYRVVAYATLMTDNYPPFRLDQGGVEPGSLDSAPPAQPTLPSMPESVIDSAAK